MLFVVFTIFRAVSQVGGKWYSFSTVLPSWGIAGLFALVLPLTWYFLGDPETVSSNYMTCWPVVASNSGFLGTQVIF